MGAFNKDRALVGAFSGHFESSRRFANISTIYLWYPGSASLLSQSMSSLTSFISSSTCNITMFISFKYFLHGKNKSGLFWWRVLFWQLGESIKVDVNPLQGIVFGKIVSNHHQHCLSMVSGLVKTSLLHDCLCDEIKCKEIQVCWGWHSTVLLSV